MNGPRLDQTRPSRRYCSTVAVAFRPLTQLQNRRSRSVRSAPQVLAEHPWGTRPSCQRGFLPDPSLGRTRHTRIASTQFCRRTLRARRRPCGPARSFDIRGMTCNSRAQKSSSAASRKKASSTSSAIRAARSSTSTTSLFKQDKVKHVLVRHEQGAVHAADGYSRSIAQGRRRPGHLGSGRHQRGDRHRHRVHGLDPDGRASPGRCRRTRSARTPSRNATPSASRARASSTTSWSRT